MEIIGQLFFVIGIAIAIVADIMIVIQAFKTSLLWGLGTLFLPIVGVVFIVLYWDKTKKYVWWILLSIVLIIIGGTLAN